MAYQKKGGNGGKRAGAGRPRNEERFEPQIKKAHALIKKRWTEVVDALIDSAIGITFRETDEDTGGINIYTKAPDTKAAMYLLDRVMGKPTQQVNQNISFDKMTDDQLLEFITGDGPNPAPTDSDSGS